MAVSENLIAGEAIVFQSKKHWMALVRASLVAALMVVGGILLNRLSPDWDGFFSFVGSILDLISIGLILAGVGWIVYNVVEWRTAEFAVTNMRVLREEGLARKRSSTTLLSSLSDVTSSVGFLGDKLGYGDLTLLTQSGNAGVDRFVCITAPIDFRNAVMNEKVADRRSGEAAAPAVAATPVAPVAAAAVAAPTMSSSEAADTIGRLAELRDSGAITTEEFEAKKADLLTRM